MQLYEHSINVFKRQNHQKFDILVSSDTMFEKKKKKRKEMVHRMEGER